METSKSMEKIFKFEKFGKIRTGVPRFCVSNYLKVKT